MPHFTIALQHHKAVPLGCAADETVTDKMLNH